MPINTKNLMSLMMQQATGKGTKSNDTSSSPASNNPAPNTGTDSSKWYAGEEPTRMEYLGAITKIYSEDKEYGSYLYEQYNNLLNDPSSSLWNRYANGTNNSINNLKNLGFDTSVLNEDWFSNPTNIAWIEQHLERRGQSNSPSAPTTKSSHDQRVAYQLYQYNLGMKKTQQADKEFNELTSKAQFLATLTDLNLSDEEIIKRVRGDNFEKEYPLMAEMENYSFSPTELNHGFDWSDDVLRGYIWMARNPGKTDNIELAMANSYLGRDNVWQYNPEIAEKLNPNSEKYQPYAIGGTNLIDAAYHFGVKNFTEDWLKQNSYYKVDGTPEDKKFFAQAEEGVQNQKAANEAVAALNEWAEQNKGMWRTAEDAKKDFDNALARGYVMVGTGTDRHKVSLKILNEMTDTVGKVELDSSGNPVVTPGSGKLKEMAGAVDYKYENFVKELREKTDKHNGQIAGIETIRDYTPSLQITDSDVAAEKEDKRKIAAAAGTVEDVATPNETTVMRNAGSPWWERTRDALTEIANTGVKAVSTWMTNSADAIKDRYFDTSLQNAYDIASYYKLQDSVEEEQKQLALLEKKYGKVETYMTAAGFEYEDLKSFTIDGTNMVGYAYYDKDKEQYVFSDIVDPRGLRYRNDPDMFARNMGSNNDALMQQVQEQINQLNYEKKAYDSANLVLTFADDQAKQEIDQMRMLKVQIAQDQKKLEEDAEDVAEKEKQLADENERVNIIRTAMGWLGMDTSSFENMEERLERISQYYDEPPLAISSYSKIQTFEETCAALDVDPTNENASAYFRKGLEDVNKQIAEIESDMEYMEMTGYIKENSTLDPIEERLARDAEKFDLFGIWEDKPKVYSDEIQRNMKYKLQNLEHEKKAYEYALIQTETSPEEYQRLVNIGKEFYQRIEDEQPLELNYSQIKDYMDVANEKEQDEYYFLLGRGVEQYGPEYERLSSSGNPDEEAFEAPKAMEKILDESIQYIDFMADPDFGTWTSRNNDQAVEAGKNNADNNGLLNNLVATALTPLESLTSSLYIIDRALTGQRINPKSGMRGISVYKESLRAETFENIDKQFPKGSFGNNLARFGYEIYVNRGDSIMNSIAFGWLFPGGDGIMANIEGAFPMAATAGLTAAANAIERGASVDQAWAICGATFVAESFTEGLTYSNIRAALLHEGKELTLNTVKEYVKDWLTSSGLEEMVGEVINNDVETYVDRLVMGDKSEFEEKVRYYMAMDPNMNEDEARGRAYLDLLNEDFHTAIVSFASPGIDVGIKAAKSGLYTANYYRVATRNMQKQGIANSTLRNMLNDYQAIRQGEAVAETAQQEQVAEQQTETTGQPVAKPAQQTASEASGAEAGVATPAQQQTAKDVATIAQAENSDMTTKTAALASALTTNEENNSETASAAATFMPDVMGENAPAIVQEAMVGAMLPNAQKYGIDQSTVKNAFQYAALGNGKTTVLVQSDEFRNASPEQKAMMLAEAYAQDQNDPQVQQNIEAKVKDYRTGLQINQLAAEGHFDQAQADQKAADQAAAETAEAEKMTGEKRDALEAAKQDLETIDSEFQQNPTDDNLKQRNDAVTRVDNADESLQQYEQHEAKAKEKQKAADEKAKKSKEDAMKTAREIAEQKSQELVQQRQAEAEARAEEQRQIEETERQRQAEEDEQTGKAQEDRENAAIEQAVADENKEGIDAVNRIDELKEQRDKVKIKLRNLTKPLTDAESMLALHAFERKLGIKINLEDMGEITEQGWTRGKYSNGTITLNKNMTLGQALVEAALHEITHSMRNTNSYNAYRNIVMNTVFGQSGDAKQLYDSNEGFRAKIDATINERVAAGDQNFVGKSLDEQIAAAEDEIVADFARLNLSDKDVVQRFMDAGMGGKMRNILHNINQALKNYFSKMTDEERQMAEYFRKAERAFQKAMEEAAKKAVHPDAEQFSVVQMAQSTGLTYNEDTLQMFLPDGREVDGVNVKITPDMMVNTPVGMLIDMGLSDEVFTGKDGQQHTQKGDARQMFADLMNLCARYKDNNLIWEIAGSEFAENFSALKSNSDPQYKTTVDFGTICAKTQAIVDVISGTMLERIKAIKEWNEAHPDDQKVFTGLTREDIMMVYDKTHDAQLSVPCPVCYVFSRWMGVPSLLGQMNRFQHEYVVTEKDENGKTRYDENGNAMIDWEATSKVANDYIKAMLEKYGDKEKIADTKTSLNNKIKGRAENLPKLYEARAALEQELARTTKEITAELERTDLDKKERRRLEALLRRETKKLNGKLETNQKNITKNIQETDAFTEQLREVEGYNWVTQALCLQHTEAKGKVVNDIDENGNYVIDQNFVLTPEEILFDLNRTGEFAAYKKNWKYRTTRGAGMGKAIMPYSGASLGDIVNGQATRWQQDQNPFYNMNRAEAEKAFENAKKRVRQQNLVGGQRFQSTSDFRPEWGLDYVMSFLEMQALGSKVQMYTKVAEAVDFLGSIGADVNLSIMARGNGFHEATPEEIALSQKDTDEGRELKSRMGTLDGKTYVMEFSDVTGMDYNTAKGKTKKFNNVQMILVGMNDIHIRLAMANEDIDFIIPWHSSGNSKDVLQSLVASVDETLTESSDYTDFQTDQTKSHKETIDGKEKTIDDRTENEIKLWDARVKLLSEGGEALTEEERNILLSNPYTKELYKRFTEEGYDADCYKVVLPKAQAEQIFPYEYWDKTSTRENADVNGQRFAEYCDALGLVPRFSQFKDDPGYWKLLIDRKMYDNNVLNDDGTVKEYGKYREQQVVDVTKARMDTDASQELDAKEARKAQVYQLPESTTAKYGQNYSEETQTAIYNANAALDEKYGTFGRYNAYAGTGEQMSYSGELSDSELEMLNNQRLKNAGVITQEDIDAYNEMTSRPKEGMSTKWSQKKGPAQRQFGSEGGMLSQSDEIAQEAIKYVMDHNAYFPDTNLEQITRAINWIRQNGSTKDENGNVVQQTDGYAESIEKITGKSFDYRSADGQARMIAVMGMAVAKNDVRAQIELADAFNRQGTDLGRALQARKLFKLMTPAGRIGMLQKMIQNYQDELKTKGKNDIANSLHFSEWIYRAAAAAETDADMRNVQAFAATELGMQMPANWKDRLTALRMVSMLANPRTHIRNIVGNMMFVPAVSIKNKIAALGEIITRQDERTKTLAPVVSKERRQFARQYASEIKGDLTGESKFNEQSLVRQNQKKLGAVGDFIAEWNGNFLEGEDWLFLKGHFRRAFGGWMQANGYTVEQVKNDPALLQKGREYALLEAQKATYRDFSATAQWLNDASNKGGAKGFIIDTLLPFKKTPINILKRGVEYSPIGIAKGLWNMARHLGEYQDYANGKIDVLPDKAVSPNQVIDQLSAGLTGTGIFILGYLLAGTGAVTCGLDDDEDEFEKLKGSQAYAVNPGKLVNDVASLITGTEVKLLGEDVTYTMDWAVPAVLTFFTGAAVRDYSDKNGWNVSDVVAAFENMIEPAFNLSMLDGMRSFLRTNSYGKESPEVQAGEKLAMNFLSSFFPSALGAITRTFDDTRRTSFVTKGDNFESARYVWESIENKIPGLAQSNIPYMDVWGNPEVTPNVWERIFENFISPGYSKEYKADEPVVNELQRLYQITGDKKLIPEFADTSISFSKDGEKVVNNLGPEEWKLYHQTRGQLAYKMLNELANNEEYQALGGDKLGAKAQVEVVNAIWKYATKVGEKAVFPDDIDVLDKNVDGLVQEGKVSYYKNSLLEAVEEQDDETYTSMYWALENNDVDDNSIKTSITNHYKPLYEEAYKLYKRTGKEEYLDKMYNIREKLDFTGLYTTEYLSWQDEVDKKN